MIVRGDSERAYQSDVHSGPTLPYFTPEVTKSSRCLSTALPRPRRKAQRIYRPREALDTARKLLNVEGSFTCGLQAAEGANDYKFKAICRGKKLLFHIGHSLW